MVHHFIHAHWLTSSRRSQSLLACSLLGKEVFPCFSSLPHMANKNLKVSGPKKSTWEIIDFLTVSLQINGFGAPVRQNMLVEVTLWSFLIPLLFLELVWFELLSYDLVLVL